MNTPKTQSGGSLKPVGWAAVLCETGTDCVIVRIGDTERHLAAKEAAALAARLCLCLIAIQERKEQPNAAGERLPAKDA